MHTRWLFGVAAAALMVFGAGHSHAQGLAGQVTSADEGAMEGVVVSAKKAGSNITVSVVTNAQGRYTFPAARLDAGQYTISARANGYDLEGPVAATIAAGQGSADLKMRKARNLAR